MKAPVSGLPIGNADIKFAVHGRDGKIGTLLVSAGAIEWRPFQGKFKRKYTWERFDQLMVDGKKPKKKRQA